MICCGLLRAGAAAVAIGATDLREITDIHRVLEHGFGRSVHRASDGAVLLRKYGVAGIAILRDDFTLSAYMLSVVAAETSWIVKVADVVRVGLPIHLHIGKHSALVDALYFVHGVADV